MKPQCPRADVRRGPRVTWGLLLVLAGGLGCTAQSAPGGSCTTDGGCPASDGGRPLPEGGRAADGAAGDTRRPPPISGGTLIITRDGTRAVAANPETDQVAVVGMSARIPGCDDCETEPKLMATVQLPRGEEPGRLVQDGLGRVHVVLRRGGAVATIDVKQGELLARRAVCAAPRGIAYDEGADLLHVACASGALVSLSPLTGEVVRRVSIDVDLRDVVVVPGGVAVSRFKSAEILRLDAEGQLVERIAPSGIERGPQTLSDLTTEALEPAVAWRMIGSAGGRLFLLHQYGVTRPIPIGKAGAVTAPPVPYGAQATSRCGGIVEQTVSTFEPGGGLDMGIPMPVLALSVDVAASFDGSWLAVAHAGAVEDKVTIYSSNALPSRGRSPVGCADNAGRLFVEGQPVAVAFIAGRVPEAAAENDWLVVQSRHPDALDFFNSYSSRRVQVSIAERRPDDAGLALFHTDTGGGIACAQCHPEGGEDGRVWNFDPQGPRRTQALHVGLEGTAPFHWDGSQSTLEALFDEVLVRRMGAEQPTATRLDELRTWLFSLQPPEPIVDPKSPAAARGREIFESAEAGCSGCHAGPGVAKSESFDVGVSSPEKFQIPALRGVGYRAPFLHDGCAGTLEERFASSCGGGDRHGKTSQLSPGEIDDLVAYMRSL